ncbi:MAG: phospholipid-binding protein [Pseudomonadota bacterium]
MSPKTTARHGATVVVAVPLIFLAATEAFAKKASLHASFSWAGIPACAKISPAFTISDAPPETKSLRFTLHDKDAPHFHHGGSKVAYDGRSVPQGAISYIGPCPPAGEVHHYVWTVEALDAQGHALARTTAAGEFPTQ